MRYILFFIFFISTVFVYAQDNPFGEDYTYFGRKEPISIGSAFSALGSGMIPVNPADIAFRTDNRVSIGMTSGILDYNGGFDYNLSWMAPNFALSSAQQYSVIDPEQEKRFEKRLMQFTFGISTIDLGLTGSAVSAALGVNLKRQLDYIQSNRERQQGGSALAVDVGLVLRLNGLVLELAVQDFNEPQIGDMNFKYERGYVIGARYQNDKGLIVALQGLSGPRYVHTDFGLNLAAEQSFFERRLIARAQLTSYFNGPEATMQNIAAGLGTRLSSKGRLWSFLKDVELAYSLSFLALPRNVGTHMLVLTKYF